MSRPYSSSKRLTRSRHDRMIGGVCGGIADYLNADPTLIRVLVVVIALFTAAFPVAIIYLILMAVIPDQQPVPPPSVGPGRPQGYQPWEPYHRQQSDPVWGPQGAPWEQPTQRPGPPRPRQTQQDMFSQAKYRDQPSGPGQAGNPGHSDSARNTPGEPS
jgi:phage shock protein PspC (stress-responsive transcriptional regulator)